MMRLSVEHLSHNVERLPADVALQFPGLSPGNTPMITHNQLRGISDAFRARIPEDPSVSKGLQHVLGDCIPQDSHRGVIAELART